MDIVIYVCTWMDTYIGCIGWNPGSSVQCQNSLRPHTISRSNVSIYKSKDDVSQPLHPHLSNNLKIKFWGIFSYVFHASPFTIMQILQLELRWYFAAHAWDKIKSSSPFYTNVLISPEWMVGKPELNLLEANMLEQKVPFLLNSFFQYKVCLCLLLHCLTGLGFELLYKSMQSVCNCISKYWDISIKAEWSSILHPVWLNVNDWARRRAVPHTEASHTDPICAPYIIVCPR